MKKEITTLKDWKQLVGRKISWKAPGYKKLYRGIALIEAVEEGRFPLTTQTIEGDDLSFAFFDFGHISYSDWGRFISVEL